ncbi:Fluconazole resistance protein 1 [Diplodia intermedia]|uniref:Fluconazole resistance protein 1 n=1 Tax=Diplodia intermedia TaxID=856260 RepID=A0ABR3TRF1_9PEZI
MESPTDNNIRKRVCKACDRCRLKKSKCDGSSPCGRCKADNAICVFGERKKSHDKVYPKGYVEMLEQQQSQLVAGLRELYRRLNAGEGWPGAPLAEQQGGHPLTHDILERLDLLQSKEGSSQFEPFEEDFTRMEKRLRDEEEAQAGPALKRRGSIGSESDHAHASSPSSHGSPPTPPKMHWEPSYPRAPSTLGTSASPVSMNQPLQHGLPLNDPSMKPQPQFWDARHTAPQTTAELMRSPFAMEDPILETMMAGGLATSFDFGTYDAPMDPYSGQPIMSDPWITSINPSALQNDFSTQFA